jgi:hypothetical protein
MKKILIALMFTILMFPVFAYGAAGTFTVVDDNTYRSGGTGDYIREVILKAVGNSSDGSIPDLILNADTSGLDRPLTGWSISMVHIDGDHAGAHDGSADAVTLTDEDAGFPPDLLIGYTISNATDSSTATITDNTASTVTGTLSGGSQNDWDVGDTYTIAAEPTENSELYIYLNGYDILEAGGVDQVDNTTERNLYCKLNSAQANIPIVSDLTVTITQQATATNSALIFIKLILE